MSNLGDLSRSKAL